MAQQIKKKFLGNDQVDGSKILLLHGQKLRQYDVNGIEFFPIDTETARAQAAEAQIASDLSAETSRAQSAEATLTSNLNAETSRATAAENTLTTNLNSEISRAQAEEVSIRADFASADTTKLNEAKAYADQKISDLVNGAGAALDTLNELAAALGNDSNFATTVANNIAAEQARAEAAEATLTSNLSSEISRAQSAEAALSARITTQEAKGFHKKKIVLSAPDIAAGYVDLDHTIVNNSLNAFVDRLAIHLTDDYILSVVSSKTRVTFVGDLVNPGAEALSSGDVLRFVYAY